MKYIVKEQNECSHRIFSVVNSESGARINYFQDRSEAEEFAAHQNSFCKIKTNIIHEKGRTFQ